MNCDIVNMKVQCGYLKFGWVGSGVERINVANCVLQHCPSPIKVIVYNVYTKYFA